MSGTYIKYPPDSSGAGGSSGAPLVVGTIDSVATSANGATIGSSSLYMQSASGLTPGLVNGLAQSFSGAKTFTVINATTANITSIVSTTVTTGSVSQTSTAAGVRYTVNWPASQGAGSTFLQNDGSGNLSWSLASGGGAGGSSIVMGTFDSIAPTANGATIGSGFLFLQSSTATLPGLISSASQTIAGVKTFSSQPIISSLTASAPVRSDGSKGLISGSISLTIDVTGNLPLSQTSGSISLVNQVSGNLPLSQTSGSISLVNQVSGSLPLAQTSGSISLTTQVSGTLPANNTQALSALNGAINLSTQTTSSISLTTQVSGVLPAANTSALSALSGAINLSTQTTSSISLTTQVSGVLPAANTSALSALSGAINLGTQTTNSISLTTQVSGVLPLANGGFTNPLTASGDLLVGSASGVIAKLAKGNPGQSLVSGSSTGGELVWRSPSIAYSLKASTTLSNATNVKISSMTATLTSGSLISYDVSNDRWVFGFNGIARLHGSWTIAPTTVSTMNFQYRINGSGSAVNTLFSSPGYTGSWTNPDTFCDEVIFSVSSSDYVEFLYTASAAATPTNVKVILQPIGNF